MKSILKELRAGFIANFFSKFSNVILHLILGIILARLLTPKDFGIVSIVMVFVVFFNLLSELGLSPAIIQQKNLTSFDISNLFNFSILIAFVLSAAFFFLSYPISSFYNNDEYIRIGKLLSVSVLFFSLNIVPLAILRKDKRFFLIAKIQIAVNIISALITVYLAYTGWKYYSIVVRNIIVSVLTFFLCFVFTDIKFRKSFNLEPIKKMLQFASFQFAFSLVNYFSKNSDKFIIGKYLGEIQLGYYDISYKLMLYPIQNIAHIITPSIHPVLAQYQDNLDIIVENYNKLIHLLALVGVPVSVFLFFISEEVIIFLYGAKWAPSAPIFSILSMTIWIQMILSSSGAIYQTMNRTWLMFISGTTSAITNIGLIFVGIYYQTISSVAIFLLIAYYINFVKFTILMYPFTLKSDIRTIYTQLITPMFHGFLLAGTLYLFEQFFNFSIILNLAAKSVLTGIVFLAGIYITRDYKFLIHMVRN
jgi:O-antigen/teichoic acid export membrane protein